VLTPYCFHFTKCYPRYIGFRQVQIQPSILTVRLSIYKSVLAIDCPSSRIQLVATTFEAFTELSSKFEENQRESLRAIAVSFYSGMLLKTVMAHIIDSNLDMLKAESTAIDLASSILPSLKRLLSPPSPAALAYAKTAHAFLSQCVVNIDTS
jgi:hypothetical protein